MGQSGGQYKQRTEPWLGLRQAQAATTVPIIQALYNQPTDMERRVISDFLKRLSGLQAGEMTQALTYNVDRSPAGIAALEKKFADQRTLAPVMIQQRLRPELWSSVLSTLTEMALSSPVQEKVKQTNTSPLSGLLNLIGSLGASVSGGMYGSR